MQSKSQWQERKQKEQKQRERLPEGRLSMTAERARRAAEILHDFAVSSFLREDLQRECLELARTLHNYSVWKLIAEIKEKGALDATADSSSRITG